MPSRSPSAPAARPLGVGRGVAGDPLPHVERFGRRTACDGDLRVGGVPGVAGDADDASGSAVGRHSRRRAQARDLPGMAIARSAMMFFWISVEPPPIVE